MKEPIGVYMELSEEECRRMIAEEQEKARRDEASRVNWARKEGIKKVRRERDIEIARYLLREDIPIDEIVEATGLTRNEIKLLCEDRQDIVNLLKSGKSPEEIIREYGGN